VTAGLSWAVRVVADHRQHRDEARYGIARWESLAVAQLQALSAASQRQVVLDPRYLV
jgi:hypothetical protein